MFSDLNLFFAIAASSLTIFLGLLVLLHDRKSATSLIFFTHAVIGSLWSISTYFSVVAPEDVVIHWVRLVLFFAVPHVFLFLLFILNFPSGKIVYPKQFLGISVVMVSMMALTQTNYVFEGTKVVNGQVLPMPGSLMPIFSIVLIGFFLSSVWMLARRVYQSNGVLRRQWISIGAGLSLSYILLIFLVFVRVIAFYDPFYVPYSPLFILPIFIGTAQAILRHKLFNVKIVTTELLVFVLLLASFVQVIIAENSISLGLALAVILFILIAGISLIRSVLREVKQREQLQQLSSELAVANEQLTVLDKARAEFISIASHQLRTPPSTIKWYLAAVLAGDYGKLSSKTKDALSKAQITNNDLIGLIDDMLNTSRIERGAMEFLFEDTDIVQLAKKVVDELVPQATMKKMKLVWIEPKQKLPNILTDKEKLAQVINNLIDNAIKYGKQGQIKVEMSKTKSDILIKISDQGKGIAPEDLQGIFQKYGRGKDSQQHASGLGLGLYVAKVVAEHHKGKIWAESKGPGKGSTFIVSLPIKTDLKAEIFDLTKAQTATK